MKKPIQIATVYRRDFLDNFSPSDMSLVRWLKISESLAEIGFNVDMIVNSKSGLVQKGRNLRYVPYCRVDWSQYDIIKTLFHKGFESLCSEGQDSHPFIISKLGSVVGNRDGTEGVHFFNQEREELFEAQKKIDQKAKYITILTEPSKRLWEREFGEKTNIVFVPTGVDREIPPPGRNPYSDLRQKIAVYIGNLYGDTQRDVNLLWQHRLNVLGSLLKKYGVRLCLVGAGNVSQLDLNSVTYLGPIDNSLLWDYQYFADVGIALAQGKVQHNESSKIYYYLRTGLPVVSEAPIPNNHLVKEANLGFVAGYADDQEMVEMIVDAVHKKWSKEDAINYILSHHTWNKRAQVYDALIREEFSLETEVS